MKILLCLILLVPAAHCFQKQDREEITKTLVFPEKGPAQRILVDNVYGSITIRGYDGDDVKLKAIRSTKAESDARLAEAKEDVVLQIRERHDKIEIVVDAPWRFGKGSINDRGYRYYGYSVLFDFELQVPRKTGLYLRTVNDGDIEVSDVEGVFEVHNVNGNVSMTNIAGSGAVGTVNGTLDVTFSRNPSGDCDFRTVNGKVNVSFPKSLSADLILKTFNGKAYTDFDIAPLARREMKKEGNRRRTVYHIGNDYAVRIGDGGPQLAFDTLNGNINIRKNRE